MAVALILALPMATRRTAETALSGAILQGSLASFKAGSDAAVRDVKAIGVDIGETIAVEAAEVDAVELAQRARAAAKNWFDDWSARLDENRADDVGERAARREAAQEVEYRLDRVAATETPGAFNEARRETIRASVKQADVDPASVVRVWRCEADACEVCQTYDGETAPLNGRYSHGHEPGAVHPRCRCSEEFRTVH